MQLHVISLLPVVVLLINRRNGLRLAGALIATSAFLGAIKVYLERFPPDTVITSKTYVFTILFYFLKVELCIFLK